MPERLKIVHYLNQFFAGIGGEDHAGELPPIAGRYGAFHTQDFYGFGNQSREDY